ncbi:ATP-binding cassette domain-containing protein [Streptomyces californicus]|uniref:ABC transporter ATP-binding protein n=1 Tax=Streptomyces TaxID=1883 RepID=UPI00067CD678|nr:MULTISPECIES: ATP-binding cassette domain-containing protein [unclassified Streptomyces]
MQRPDDRTDADRPAIELVGVRKAFTTGRLTLRRHRFIPKVSRETRHREVLTGIDLSVPTGEVLGYVGENGSGKTTTLRLISGIVHPDSGSIRLHGRSPHDDREVKRDLGIVFGQRTQLWWDLPARTSFEILADIYSVSRSDLRKRLAELDELFGVSEYWDTPVRHLSLGQRMQCDLVAAVIHRPRILILDEPTIGLDAAARARFRVFVEDLRRSRTTTVLLTTHDLNELARMSDSLAVLVDGRVGFRGSLGALRTQQDLPTMVKLSLFGPAEGLGPEPLPGVRLHSVSGDTATYRLADRAHVGPLLAHVAGRADIRDVHVVEVQLDDLVRHLYEGVSSPSASSAEAS